MKKFFVCYGKDLVLTEEEFNNLKTGRILFSAKVIDLEIGKEYTIDYINDCLSLVCNYDELNNISASDILDNESLSYMFTDNYGVNVTFKITQKINSTDEAELLKTVVEVTDIYLI